MRNVLNKLKNTFIKNKKPILQSFVFIGYIVALVFLFVLIINVNVVAQTDDQIYSIGKLDSIEDDFDCILILGGGVRADGSPTPMLRDRLISGFDAYNNISCKTVFVTGDSEESDYTETVTMQNELMQMGVKEENITCDGYGLSTYESIWRAKYVYGYNKILIVSQKYHLNRAIYIANKLGVDAIGVDAALTTYRKQPYYSLRECFARIKDVLYSEMLPNPKYSEMWRDANE